jgi:hypothetical protein
MPPCKNVNKFTGMLKKFTTHAGIYMTTQQVFFKKIKIGTGQIG